MKSSFSHGRRATRSGTPRVSALHAAVAGAFVALPMLFAAAPAGAVQFIATDLGIGTLGGISGSATGINAAGQVVGTARISGNVAERAFLWQGGAMQDLGTLGGAGSAANGINAAGQVVGYANTSGGAANHAFLWQAGAMQDLGTLGGTDSFASGINAAGQVVGGANTTGDTARRAFLWQAGAMQNLGTLGGTFSSHATGVNAAGQVVGMAHTTGDTALHAFLWQAGAMQDLGTLGGRDSVALGINAAGQVVGYANTSGNAASRAFLWQAGTMQDLGTLGGANSVASAINAAGQVVGNSDTTIDAPQNAFLRGARGGMVNLNALLVAGSAAVVNYAAAVNDFGQIAGTATFDAGGDRAVLLTPTGTLAWLGSGAGGSFSDVANWELGFAPNGFLDAVVAPAGRQTLYASVDVTVRNLSLGGAAGSSGRPQLVLLYGANLSAINVVIQPTGTLTGDGRISGHLTNLGTVRADNLSVSETFVNAGLVNGSGYLNATMTNVASGTVRTAAGEHLRVVGRALTNTGRIEVTSGGMQEFIGPFSNAGTLDISGGATQQYTDGLLANANGGRILLNNAVLRVDRLSNAGQLQVSFGGATVHGLVVTSSGGKIILSGNSNTTFYDAQDVQSGGELRVSNGSTAVFFGQVNQRTGSIFSGTGAKFYEGGLSIGGSPGLGHDAGNVSFGSGNVYLEEIGGLAAGTEFDKYLVAGSLSFGGTMKVVLWGGFAGAEGQSFDLFDWGSSTGTFSTLDFSAAPLAAGLAWDTSRLYLTGEIAITAVPEPESWALWLAGLVIVGRAARRARRARD